MINVGFAQARPKLVQSRNTGGEPELINIVTIMVT